MADRRSISRVITEYHERLRPAIQAVEKEFNGKVINHQYKRGEIVFTIKTDKGNVIKESIIASDLDIAESVGMFEGVTQLFESTRARREQRQLKLKSITDDIQLFEELKRNGRIAGTDAMYDDPEGLRDIPT
jgi:hypothetical protein